MIAYGSSHRFGQINMQGICYITSWTYISLFAVFNQIYECSYQNVTCRIKLWKLVIFFLSNDPHFIFLWFQVLTFLENAIKRDWLSSIFETTNELMDASNSKKCVAIGPFGLETVITLPWIPPTTAAVALRLMEFDAAISYRLHQEVESSVEEGSGYSLVSFLIFLLLQL